MEVGGHLLCPKNFTPRKPPASTGQEAEGTPRVGLDNGEDHISVPRRESNLD
jgi:hypothetical protein